MQLTNVFLVSLQITLIYFHPVDSGALQLTNDNLEMTLGKFKNHLKVVIFQLRHYSD